MNEITKTQNVRGLEQGSSQELLLGRILLMQKLSTFVEGGAKPGTLVHSLSRQEIKSPVFVPCIFTKYADLYEVNGTGKAKFQERVFDLTNPKLEERRFFSNEEGRADAIMVLSYISIVDGKPAIVAFSKSSYGAGKKLYTFAHSAGVDLWAKRYKLLVNSKTNDQGTFFVLDIAEAGDSTQSEREIAESLYHAFSKKTREMHSQDLKEDGTPAWVSE